MVKQKVNIKTIRIDILFLVVFRRCNESDLNAQYIPAGKHKMLFHQKGYILNTNADNRIYVKTPEDKIAILIMVDMTNLYNKNTLMYKRKIVLMNQKSFINRREAKPFLISKPP